MSHAQSKPENYRAQIDLSAGQERQRYHTLLLVAKGYSYRETADILFVDKETISRSLVILSGERPQRLEE
jgi:hypothetical protein